MNISLDKDERYSAEANNIFLSFAYADNSRGNESPYIKFNSRGKIKFAAVIRTSGRSCSSERYPMPSSCGEFKSNRWKNTVGGCLRCLEKLAPPFCLRRTFAQPFISPPAERLFSVISRTMLQISIPLACQFRVTPGKDDEGPFLCSILMIYPTGRDINFHSR